MPLDKYAAWMKESSVDEKKELAVKAKTSLNMLYQLGSAHRQASASLAGKIETGIASIAKRKRDPILPLVQRGDLCEACAKCKFYKELK